MVGGLALVGAEWVHCDSEAMRVQARRVVAVPSASAAAPFARARAQHGALAAVHHICRAAGDDSAVLVHEYHYLDVALPQPISGFCGVPVGRATAVDLSLLARQWHELGRRLLVATAVPDAVLRNAPGARIVGHETVAGDEEPERVFDRAPRRNKAIPFDIWLLQIPADAPLGFSRSCLRSGA